MAKSSGSAVLGDGTYDKTVARRFLKEVERHLGEMESKKGEYMAWCKSTREQINKIYDRASDAGIPKKILKAHVKRRELEGRLELLSEFEDAEDTTQYKQLYLALEDEVPDDVRSTAKPLSKGMPGADAPATH